MSTTTRLPFAALMEKATPGPFEVLTYERNPLIIASTSGTLVCDTIGNPKNDDVAADAEIIARLLNFAAAGGVQLLQDYLSESSTDGRAIRQEQRDQLRRHLAQLNGEEV